MYSCTRKGTIVDLQIPHMEDIEGDINTLQKNEKDMRAANVVRALCCVVCCKLCFVFYSFIYLCVSSDLFP